MKFSKPIVICSAWIVTALLFNAGIYVVQGPGKALEFLTGYIIELSLSVDNLFVFYLIFSQFKVSPADQNKILTFGILGAQLMRGIFILGGIALLRHFTWMIYIFGALLAFSGFKVFFKTNHHVSLDQNPIVRFLGRIFHAQLSPFLYVLILIELADLVFAIDSIPAVLAVTKDPFIVYSSNIFAILGLRSMYQIFAPLVDQFHYLHYGLGIILIFVGAKMMTENLWHMPVGYTLGFIGLTLILSVLASLFKGRISR